MSDLVPEQRRDKNGTMVTRWVRKESQGKPSGKSMPKVGASQEDRLRTRRERTINRMTKLLMIHGYHEDAEATKGFLNESIGTYTNLRSMEVIDAALKKDPTQATTIDLILSDYSEDKARELIYFMDYVSEDIPENERDALMAGLRDYERFSGVNDFTTLQGAEDEAAIALVKVGSQVLAYDPQYDDGIKHPQGYFRWYLTDQTLVKTVLANLESVDKIMDFMKERRIFDGEAVAQYLNEYAALNEGFL